MKLSRTDLLKNSNYKESLESLLGLAEQAFKDFHPIWSPFIAAPILQEVSNIFDQLTEINCKQYGGFNGAERKRILFQRNFDSETLKPTNIPIIGIQVSGNFLFDPTSPRDFLNDLKNQGITEENIGDIWIIGDRGAQLFCTPEAGDYLNKKESSIRTVKIKYESIKIDQLRLPHQRKSRKITTVEASKRLDAIASAGFGISRSKIANDVKQRKLRLNWVEAISNSQLLKEGDQIQLLGKGSLKILSMQITKKERWKIELLRE